MASEEKKVFTVSDESLNSYGSWVLTAGIEMTNFLKNPIMLYNHNRAWRGTEDEVLPIGRWLNPKIEKASLLAEPDFDMNDPFAAKIGNKVEKGFLKGASIGIKVIEYSEDPKYLKPGQRCATITKCELVEISIVDIPSNKNAVALYDQDGTMLKLGDAGENLPLPILKLTEKSHDMDLKDTAKLLGLAETASQADINAAIAAKDAQLKGYADRENAAKKAERDTLLTAALADGRLHSDTQRPNWEKLFDADHETAKASLESLPKVKKLGEIVKPENGKPGDGTHNGKTFSQLSRENPAELARLKSAQPEVFAELGHIHQGRLDKVIGVGIWIQRHAKFTQYFFIDQQDVSNQLAVRTRTFGGFDLFGCNGLLKLCPLLTYIADHSHQVFRSADAFELIFQRVKFFLDVGTHGGSFGCQFQIASQCPGGNAPMGLRVLHQPIELLHGNRRSVFSLNEGQLSSDIPKEKCGRHGHHDQGHCAQDGKFLAQTQPTQQCRHFLALSLCANRLVEHHCTRRCVHRSHFARDQFAERIHIASKGLIGVVSQLALEAAGASLIRSDGPLCLTLADFADAYDSLPYDGVNPFDPRRTPSDLRSNQVAASRNAGPRTEK